MHPDCYNGRAIRDYIVQLLDNVLDEEVTNALLLRITRKYEERGKP
jgi:hypothetical protein